MIANITTALGWALLHSFWQGAALALTLFALLPLFGKSQHRYLVACAALFLLPVSFVSTALWVYTPDVTDTLTGSLTTLWFSTTSLVAVGSLNWQTSPYSLEPFLPLLVWLWLLGVILFGLRLLGGFIYLGHVRAEAHADTSLQTHLDTLAKAMGVSITPTIKLSSSLASPLLTGWLRPVILLPVSAASGLTPAQLESILLHELAHIKRYDPLINRLQTYTEILFFYHPASWYLSFRVRQEREYCCDDFVLSVTGDRATYAQALTKLETLRSSSAQLALSATGGQFMNRIRRILQPSAGQARAKGIALTLLLSVILVACSANLFSSRGNDASVNLDNICLSASVSTGKHMIPAFNTASVRAMSSVLSEAGLGLTGDCSGDGVQLAYTMTFDAQSLTWQAHLQGVNSAGRTLWTDHVKGDIEEDGAFQYTTESTAETLLKRFLAPETLWEGLLTRD